MLRNPVFRAAARVGAQRSRAVQRTSARHVAASGVEIEVEATSVRDTTPTGKQLLVLGG